MRASGEKFIGIFHPSECGAGWVAFLTWRLGFRGPYLVRGTSKDGLQQKLKNLDPTVAFFSRGKSHGFDAPPVREEGRMIMLRNDEVGDIKLALHVEHGGSPFWLTVNRGMKRAAEVVTKIFDDRAVAEKAYESVALGLSYDHLRATIGDERRFIRLMDALNVAEKVPAFIAIVKSRDEAAIEPVLLRLLDESDGAVN
jgi:hypothetical protein